MFSACNQYFCTRRHQNPSKSGWSHCEDFTRASGWPSIHGSIDQSKTWLVAAPWLILVVCWGMIYWLSFQRVMSAKYLVIWAYVVSTSVVTWMSAGHPPFSCTWIVFSKYVILISVSIYPLLTTLPSQAIDAFIHQPKHHELTKHELDNIQQKALCNVRE